MVRRTSVGRYTVLGATPNFVAHSPKALSCHRNLGCCDRTYVRVMSLLGILETGRRVRLFRNELQQPLQPVQRSCTEHNQNHILNTFAYRHRQQKAADPHPQSTGDNPRKVK